MRYYEITLGDQTYTSLGADGLQNPGALNVEIDISVAQADVPMQGSYFRIWGPGLQAISQANNLYDKPVSIKAGMSQGLPLANPSQAGVICSGKVWRAFGNWIGVNQTLDIFVTQTADGSSRTPGPAPQAKPNNIIQNGKKDQPVGEAIKNALTSAFPDLTVNMNISDQLKFPSDQPGFFGGIEQFAEHWRQYSRMLGSTIGVGIHIFDGQINVTDETHQESAPQIAFTDLIGQPTWIDVGTMQITAVMRADIHVAQKITLPKTLVTSTVNGGVNSAGSSAPQQSLSFQGDFTVKSVRHVGNYRQPDASSWVTVIDAYTTQSS